MRNWIALLVLALLAAPPVASPAMGQTKYPVSPVTLVTHSSPGGGSDEKPAGTVVIGVTTADARIVRTYRFPAGRARVRQFAAQMALDLARRVLLGVEAGRAFGTGAERLAGIIGAEGRPAGNPTRRAIHHIYAARLQFLGQHHGIIQAPALSRPIHSGDAEK